MRWSIATAAPASSPKFHTPPPASVSTGLRPEHRTGAGPASARPRPEQVSSRIPEVPSERSGPHPRKTDDRRWGRGVPLRPARRIVVVFRGQRHATLRGLFDETKLTEAEDELVGAQRRLVEGSSMPAPDGHPRRARRHHRRPAVRPLRLLRHPGLAPGRPLWSTTRRCVDVIGRAARPGRMAPRLRAVRRRLPGCPARPGSGYSRIGWHTDHQSGPHLDIWPGVAFTIHFDPTSPANGFLRVLPGSHRGGTAGIPPGFERVPGRSPCTRSGATSCSTTPTCGTAPPGDRRRAAGGSPPSARQLARRDPARARARDRRLRQERTPLSPAVGRAGASGLLVVSKLAQPMPNETALPDETASRSRPRPGRTVGSDTDRTR